MKSETKQCQNCKKDFVIEAEDFNFYEKIKVPPPTFCPECNLQRRLSWRNERFLYKRKCDAPGHEEILISMYSQELKTLIYDQKYWHGDDWDPFMYGMDYDFSKSFFKQWKNLLDSVPVVNLVNLHDIKSDYCNYTYQSKNCFLNFASDMNEDTAYLYHSIRNKNCFDMLGSSENENCSNLIDSNKCYQSEYLNLSEECINSKYCYDCRNCQNCIGCVGLRNKQYCILNEQYSKETYTEFLKELNLENKIKREKFEKDFFSLLNSFPRKFSNYRQVINSTGDYLRHAKNCQNCFDIEGPAEDLVNVIYSVTNLKNV